MNFCVATIYCGHRFLQEVFIVSDWETKTPTNIYVADNNIKNFVDINCEDIGNKTIKIKNWEIYGRDIQPEFYDGGLYVCANDDREHIAWRGCKIKKILSFGMSVPAGGIRMYKVEFSFNEMERTRHALCESIFGRSKKEGEIIL